MKAQKVRDSTSEHNGATFKTSRGFEIYLGIRHIMEYKNVAEKISTA